MPTEVSRLPGLTQSRADSGQHLLVAVEIKGTWEKEVCGAFSPSSWLTLWLLLIPYYWNQGFQAPACPRTSSSLGTFQDFGSDWDCWGFQPCGLRNYLCQVLFCHVWHGLSGDRMTCFLPQDRASRRGPPWVSVAAVGVAFVWIIMYIFYIPPPRKVLSVNVNDFMM